MSGLVPVGSNELVNELLHNPYDRGWHFMSGDPEFWHYSDALLTPGGRLLDIGAGIGRSSLYFALHGMEVTALDNDAAALAELPKLDELLSPLAKGSITPLDADMLTADFGHQQYDTVIMDKNLVHAFSKEDALEVIRRGWAAVKREGHIWIRAVGKEDAEYDRLLWETDEEPGTDVLETLCNCSGEVRYDPVLFFDQTDLLQYFAHEGARIIHSQLLPQTGHANIMFGEDHNDGIGTEQGGMISIIAQKP